MLAFNNVGVRGANPPQIQKSLYSFTVDPLYPCSMYLFEKKKTTYKWTHTVNMCCSKIKSIESTAK